MMLQAKVKNDPEVLHDLSCAVLRMIGARPSSQSRELAHA
jgi:hypothetical protein